MHLRRSTDVLQTYSDRCGISHRFTLTMCSSIDGLWTKRRTWKLTEYTFVRFFSSCASISCISVLKKRIFAASKIPLLGRIVGKSDIRPDSEKIKAITDWPVPVNVKGICKFLGLAASLHKCSRNYADMTVHLSCLLKKMSSGHGTLTVSVTLKVSSGA